MAKRRAPQNPFDEFREEGLVPTLEGFSGASKREPQHDFGVEAAVEAVPLARIFPDIFQTRHPILPPGIRERFWDGEIDCFEAAREWQALTDSNPAYRDRLEELMRMGETFETAGQVNAVTGRWVVAGDDQFIFLIETGERRFWAAVLHAIVKGETESATLNVIGFENTSRKRQVIENWHQEKPGAVSQAREIAALLLDALGVSPPEQRPADVYDYFRQALDYRIPKDTWGQLQPVTGLTLRRMSQVLSLLELPTYLLEWADLYQLSSRTLLAVVQAPKSRWEELVKVAIQEKTGAAIRIEPETLPHRRKSRSDGRRDPVKSALGGLRRFRNALLQNSTRQEEMIGKLATDIVVRDPEAARDFTIFLERLVQEIQIRMENS